MIWYPVSLTLQQCPLKAYLTICRYGVVEDCLKGASAEVGGHRLTLGEARFLGDSKVIGVGLNQAHGTDTM